MDRCAVFVDAGWLLAEAAQVVTGRGQRWAVACDFAALTPALARLAQEHTGLPLLRTYWYDAAPDGVVAVEHEEIANLANVKLRLGRIARRMQKGVDALLILDLTTLARERAIASALVITGDEDIREGIAAAQTLGVRVTLGGVEIPGGRPSQAATLVQEADDQLLMGADLLSRYFKSQDMVGEPGAEPASGDPYQFGLAFASEHARSLDKGELRSLQRVAPQLPAEIAAQLFREAEHVFGPLRGRFELRRDLANGFWDHIMVRR